MLETVLNYAWMAIPLLALVFYKFTLRVFFGMVIIPEDKIGLVTKKFVLFGANRSLPDGKIIALNGEPGFQANTLAPGLYWFYWVWQFSIEQSPLTIIPQGKIGLLSAKDGAQLPTGAILARHVDCDNYQDTNAFLTNGGQRGKQVGYLNNGVYRINPFLFDLAMTDITYIEDGMVGVITALDGIPLDQGSIAGKVINDHNNFQDFDKFLKHDGQRGLQVQVVQAGNYSLNPWAVQVEKVAMTQIPIGHVGVVISYVGEEGVDTTGETFKHGNIVKKGEKGVCITPLDPGKYAINPYTHKIEVVPTTNLVLNWANARNESHQLDKGLSTITVRSKDGFPFNLDVSQIIHIPATEAPKVIARFGSMQNLVSQVLEPTIGNYFRNSAQDSDVIAFLTTRQARQNAAKDSISRVLEEYNVHAVDTLIGDITPPESLMKTLTDRKIAQEEEVTFETQRKAQDQRKTLESAKALADMQGKMVAAQQSVEISQREAEASVKRSEGEAKALELKAGAQAKAKKMMAEADAAQIKLTGDAEASKIAAIGKSTAEAYEKQVKAMGADNFGKLKVTEMIGTNGIKIIPDILISGNDGNGAINGLLGMEMLKQIQDNKQVITDVTAKKAPNQVTPPTE
ncbi:Band 7 domain containing protein [uncultured Caudovirales phage]|uniref:Band 7 domain containing protein n=1 Tax=uncultured Caudovirales phage TaxID=2100421 RepID=A0A6J5R9R2_9CAUD|nr:Band 7 domain containing protein [uncultured Caudovirales phage]CAB4193783.1 Band 7 domain containing protein [uncultured Caudovirales phage]